jgi:DNA-binding FrmR family transcriptional regulator
MRDESLRGREPREGKSTVKLADPDAKIKLLRRVRRIEGQARGVARMIEDDRDCSEILQQLAAVRSAAHQATVALVRSYATECVVSDASAEQIADALAVALSRLA